MKRKQVLMLPVMLVICLLVTAGTGRAQDSRSVDDASPQEIVNGMSNKLFRGVTNIATGWIELPKQIYVTSKDEGTAQGLLVGPVKGVGMTLVRTLSGVLETATFYMAYPTFYEPLFDPAFVWQKE